MQLTHNGQVSVDGDRATGRWYVTEYGLTAKGRKIMRAMKKEYGSKKGEEVYYASQNKGTIKGTHRKEK